MATQSQPNRALAASAAVQQLLSIYAGQDLDKADQREEGLASPLTAQSGGLSSELYDYLAKPETKRGTVLYLAYGSNLSNETFRGNRGIKPLSQINVQVPSLRLTFDLPGIPYTEPSFANSGLRGLEHDRPRAHSSKDEWLQRQEDCKRKEYHKDRWHKGLIGVVYEVTPDDYAHIIATEGGGSSYKDILVDCHPFAFSDPHLLVPQDPTTQPFKAHTLYAPPLPPGSFGGRFQRPDPAYAQPSARYLKLLVNGATELGLPYEYQEYLQDIRPYTITTFKQRAGQVAFLSTWAPVVGLGFLLSSMFAGDDGRIPEWLANALARVFVSLWASYDLVFKGTFGDGERTISDDDDDDEAGGEGGRLLALCQRPQQYDLEKRITE